jgi:hypothetical protein
MTWLYIPSTSSRSSPGSADSISDSNWPCHRLARSVMWRGKHMQPPAWWRVWRKERWIRRLSGLMLLPSRADHGARVWIASLAVSPARTYPQPKRKVERVSREERRVVYGVNMPGLLARFDLASSSPKTLHFFTGEAWILCSQTLPRWGMMLNGELYRRPELEPLTKEKERSYWLTPTSRDWKGRSTRAGEVICNQLRRLYGGSGIPNPTWVEWLMGWPLGWTVCEPVETELFPNVPPTPCDSYPPVRDGFSFECLSCLKYGSPISP